MTPVWLWWADGASSGCRGISGDREAARRVAAGRLLSGDATAATVAAAMTDAGQRTLVEGYYVIGRWKAKVGPGGRVWWVPVKAGGGRPGGLSKAPRPARRPRSGRVGPRASPRAGVKTGGGAPALFTRGRGENPPMDETSGTCDRAVSAGVSPSELALMRQSAARLSPAEGATATAPDPFAALALPFTPAPPGRQELWHKPQGMSHYCL